MPKELTNKIIIGIAIIFLQAMLLSYLKESGLIFLLGITIFLFIFSMQDKKIKKQRENNFLEQKDWFKSKYKLTKEIP